MSKDDFRTIVILVLALAIMIGGAFLEASKYKECRRVHPIWYCIS